MSENNCPNPDCPTNTTPEERAESERRQASIGEFLNRDGSRNDGALAANMLLHNLGGENFEYLIEKYHTEEDFGHIMLLGGLVLGKFMHMSDDDLFPRIADAWNKPFKYMAATSFKILKDGKEANIESLTDNASARASLDEMHLGIVEGLEKAYALFD